MTDIQQDIINFWFEETQPPQWFQKDEKFDQEIQQRFGNAYQQAVTGEFDDWKQTAEGALAFCILLDQFPRNMFRDTPQAFATDAKALAVSKYAVEQGLDQQLEQKKRWFLYLPYEHSEDLADQQKSVDLFAEMKEENPIAYDYAVRHKDVIDQYGRFPHRNKILGRDNTPEEEKYLSQDGAGF
ncbi:MAG: DUF924 family protein [Pseudomonadota bacterium]